MKLPGEIFMANTHLGIVYICSLTFGYFGRFFIVFLFNATVRYKTCCNAMLFLGNPDPLSLVSCPLVSSSYMYSKIISWHGVSCLRTFMSWIRTFDFRRNASTLSKFIGYLDLTDFCEIWPQHSRKNDKGNCVRQFEYLTYFCYDIHLRSSCLTYF